MSNAPWWFLSSIVLSAAPAQAATRQWLAPDFFVDTYAPGEYFEPGLRPAAEPEPADADCRARIATSVCVTRDTFRRGPDVASRDCQRDASRYIAFFEAAYDRFPAPFQRMFCSIKRISVEADMESIAYAGLRGRDGAVVGFRKSVIDEGLDLSTLMSWKEQLPFGGDRDGYTPEPDLPQLHVASAAAPVEDLAFYVLAHEFGHLFDFANELTTPCFPGATCAVDPDGFTALSWKNTAQPTAAADFRYRSGVCYYNCAEGELLPREAVGPLYAGLAKSPFVTMYAATNTYDDLAESLAFYVLDEQGGFTYSLTTGQGHTYDLLHKVHRKSFAPKRRFLREFLARERLAYP